MIFMWILVQAWPEKYQKHQSVHMITWQIVTTSQQKFVSTEVNEDHVLKIISDFGDSAAGWDDLKPNVIKHVKLYIKQNH